MTSQTEDAHSEIREAYALVDYDMLVSCKTLPIPEPMWIIKRFGDEVNVAIRSKNISPELEGKNVEVALDGDVVTYTLMSDEKIARLKLLQIPLG